ncbi:MAG: hypothetical protein U5N53_21800 [Mycobacterium sp.]|nr:hypothetical protein [Mycobacterium sp.]
MASPANRLNSDFTKIDELFTYHSSDRCAALENARHPAQEATGLLARTNAFRLGS